MVLINKVFIYTREWDTVLECAAAAALTGGDTRRGGFRRKSLNLTKKSPFF